MRFTYSLTLEDFRRGLKVFREIRSGRRIALPSLVYQIFGAVIFGGGIVLWWQNPDDVVSSAAFCLIGAFFLLRPLISSWYTARLYRMQKLGAEVLLDVDDQRMLAERSDGQADSTWKWPILEKWGESPEVFVILPNSATFVTIPKRVLAPEQQDELRALLTAHIPRKN